MGHKLEFSRTALRFSSGRHVYTDSIRRGIAKALCEDKVEWLKVTERLPREHPDPLAVVRNWRAVKRETSAIEWLVRRGMVERHEKQPEYYRWSPLHERPHFGADRESHEINGVKIYSLSPAQKMLLTETMVAGARSRTHDVLVNGAVPLQRMLRAMEKRGLLQIERLRGVWRLRLGAMFHIKKDVAKA